MINLDVTHSSLEISAVFKVKPNKEKPPPLGYIDQKIPNQVLNHPSTIHCISDKNAPVVSDSTEHRRELHREAASCLPSQLYVS